MNTNLPCNHTPGPWTLNAAGGRPMVGIDVHDGGDLLPIVDVVSGYDIEEANANALLISVAPELLGVLEDLLAEVVGCGCTNEKRAIGIIAKARGEAPHHVAPSPRQPSAALMLDVLIAGGHIDPAKLDQARAIVAKLRAGPGVAEKDRISDEQCESIYQAVSRANLTRDVKSPERKREIVRAAIQEQP